MSTIVIDIHKKNRIVPEHDIYIGRRDRFNKRPESKWHNPFFVDKPDKKRDGTLEEVIKKHRVDLLQNDELLEALPELHNKILGCWCKPGPCHGDTLVEFENISHLSCCAVGRCITADEFRVIYYAFQAAGRKLSEDEIREILTLSEVTP